MSSHDAARTATICLEGYTNYGPRYCPGARYFTVVSLDESGQADGGGADVCRECVSKVAGDALYVMERGGFGYDQVIRFNRQQGMTTTAVEACGPAPLYEIEGSDGEPSRDACCADCGRRLVEV